MDSEKFRYHDTYDVGTYHCGLKAGQLLRLRADLPLVDHLGNVTNVIKAGSTWTVLPGCSTDPGVVWLQEPSGERHTWDDDASIFEKFEIVTSTS